MKYYNMAKVILMEFNQTKDYAVFKKNLQIYNSNINI